MLKRRAFYICALITLLIPGSIQPQSMDRSGGWKQLFDGKDLSGWKYVGKGYMSVKNGLIETHGRFGLLYWTGHKLGNCIIRVVYRMNNDYADSGIFIRMPVEPRESLTSIHSGYEVQIDNHPERYGEDDYYAHGSLYSFTRVLAQAWKPGTEWNTMEITLDGPRTIVMLNDVKVTDYTEGDPVREARKGDPERGRRPDQGWFGLQSDMESEAAVVFFKEVAIKPLPTR